MIFGRLEKFNFETFSRAIFPVLKGEGREETCRALARRYGSIENVFCADFGELSELVGESAATYIKVLSAVTSRRYTAEFEFGKPHTKAEIAEYFKALFFTESVECVYAMLLDSDGIPISTKLISRGTVSSSDVIPRKILEAAIGEGSRRVILAHNHPHGLPKASEEDIRLTSGVSDILSLMGIKLEYHMIVAGDECDIVVGVLARLVEEGRIGSHMI